MTSKEQQSNEKFKPIARRYETGKIGFFQALHEAYDLRDSQSGWVDCKDKSAPRDIEIWVYDDDGDIVTIDPRYASEDDYECVVYWQPFFRPDKPKEINI